MYDVTYESLEPYKDNLVIIDDSIVRGTTLKESILKILDRLHPQKIVIVSSSPQIRYPDYYGIDIWTQDIDSNTKNILREQLPLTVLT